MKINVIQLKIQHIYTLGNNGHLQYITSMGVN